MCLKKKFLILKINYNFDSVFLKNSSSVIILKSYKKDFSQTIPLKCTVFVIMLVLSAVHFLQS